MGEKSFHNTFMPQLCYYTGVGGSHIENQDAIFLCGYGFTNMTGPKQMLVPGTSGMFVVLDGMGGMAGGAVASRTLLNMLERSGRLEDCEEIENFWEKAAARLFAMAEVRPALLGMGAAMAGLSISGIRGLVFNSGDCRVYRHTSGQLAKLTRDHSYVGRLYEEGIISAEAMRTHPRRNILLSAITAIPEKPRIFCIPTPVVGGDRFLLCSDGIWGELGDGELRKIMRYSIVEVGDILVKEIRKLNCPDDYSFIILQI